MSQKRKGLYWIPAVCMLVLILDSKNALSAASEGVVLCLRTAIPSLFPFFVLSALLVPGLSGLRLGGLGRLLGIPAGWEGIFVLSCVGGYPVGAQCVVQGYRAGQLSQAQARRMLGFCNNCGPAFLFGVVAPLFPSVGYGAAITVCGIFSAAMVGAFWPGRDTQRGEPPKLAPVSLPGAVRQATSSMAGVCAWIVLGKICLRFLQRSILYSMPPFAQVLLGGLLELTNGCLRLAAVENVTVRFLVAAGMISFGGVCVAMQVQSLCADTGLFTGDYFAQKLVQGLLSAVMAYSLICGIWVFFCVLAAGLFVLIKKTLVFHKETLYNGTNKGGISYAVPKKN